MSSFNKAHPVHDIRQRRRWAMDRPWCQACGVPEQEVGWRGLATHHLIKPGRSDEACNLLRLCGPHHDLAEGLAVREAGVLLPKLTPGMCLNLKKLRDPLEFDPERLAVLYHQSLPELEEIPEYLAISWTRWQALVLGRSLNAANP